jgi:hypothetical protein
MEIFHIGVLGAQAHLGERGNGQSTTVVLEDQAVDLVLVRDDLGDSVLTESRG